MTHFKSIQEAKCFYRKSNPEAGSIPLIAIDSELCAFFHAPCYPTLFYNGWFNTVGFSLVCGKDWNQIRDLFNTDQQTLKIVDWLEANFTYGTWNDLHKL